MLEQLEHLEMGKYLILNERENTPFGPCYEAIDNSVGGEKQYVFLQVILPEIANQENFSIRFELLKSLLPAIRHENLCSILELGKHKDLYFIVKEDLREWKHFSFPLLQEKQSLEFFYRLARGLDALQKVRNAYYKEGIAVEHFDEDLIWIREDRKREEPRLRVKLDALVGPFLFYGDDPDAPLKYSFQKALFRNDGNNLYEGHKYLPPAVRECEQPLHHASIYSFGCFLYHHLSHLLPKGNFPKLTEVHPNLAPFWDDCVEKCLNGQISAMSEVCKLFETHLSEQRASSTKEKQLEHLQQFPGMALIYIEDKAYLGASEGPLQEQPLFRARIQPFYIDKAPVTCAEFEQFMPNYHRSSYSKSDNHPAALISWHMAKAYCQWRSEKEGLPPGTYRLPTEYEWEAAVRGDTQDQYPWPNQINNRYIHCNKKNEEGARIVKTTPPGRFGLYDMLGNVWEWTESWYKSHPFSTYKDKTYSHHFRTVKGGCWTTPLDECRASARRGYPPQERRGDIGFRCVRPVDIT